MKKNIYFDIKKLYHPALEISTTYLNIIEIFRYNNLNNDTLEYISVKA